MYKYIFFIVYVPGLTLTQLTLPGRHSVSNTGLFFLCRHTLLSELDLSDYTHITDQGIAHLGRMTRYVCCVI